MLIDKSFLFCINQNSDLVKKIRQLWQCEGTEIRPRERKDKVIG